MKKITLSLLFGFMSLVGFSQVGLVENFDAGLALPAGWTSETGDYFGTVSNVCGGFSLRANFDATNTTGHLTSPNIVGQSNGTDLTIAFDYKIVDWAAGVDATPPGWGEIMIQYSTNDGGIWNTVETINDANHTTDNVCFNWSTTVLAASLPIGSDFKLRINTDWALGTYYVYLDNISATQVVVGPPSCVNLLTPTDGSTGNSINTDLSWSSATNIPTGYTVVVGTTPGGTDIVDNVNAGLSTIYDLPTLEYSTTYYVSIIPFNGNGDAVDCPEWTFETGADPNAPVDCAAGTPINVMYCYPDNDTMTWNFESSDGSPLNIFFNSGQFEVGVDNISIYDGMDNTNLINTYSLADMTGVSEIANSGFMFVELTSDVSISCDASAFNPLDFDISCVDTTALPNCNAALTSPLNGAVDAGINDVLNWSPASILVTGYTISIGTTPGGTDIVDNLDVGNVTTYDPGTLLYETTYYVTIVPYNDNGPAINCNEESFTTQNDPNQIVDCSINEVINTTFCYVDNDVSQFFFASSDGSPLILVFNAGSVENNFDELIVLDSDGTTNLNAATPYGAGGDLTGLTFFSTGSTMTVGITADFIISCDGGGFVPWDFDVTCLDTTIPPNCDSTLTGPLNGALDVDVDADLNWTPATFIVTGYFVSIGTTPGGTDIADNVDVGNVTTYDPGTLPSATTVYVTIIPYNDNGPAIDCVEESFTTFDATAPPNCNAVLTAPLNGAVDVNENDDLNWSPATLVVTGYFVSIGTTPGGTDIADNLDVGNVTTYDPGTLPYETTIYVTIIPYNDNGPATGCTEESFTVRPDPNQILDCSINEVINTVYCYGNNDTMQFNFASNDGSQLAVVFNSGTTENNFDELIVLDSDGATNLNAATPYGAAGNLAGLVFISTGDSVTVGVTSDGSVISCTGNPWNFDVFCFDATAPPNCTSMTTPVDGAIEVDINTDITWTPAALFVTGYFISIGTTPGGTDIADNVDVGNVLTYDPGVLTNATFYYVTITPYNDNGPAIGCTEESFKTICIPHEVSFNAIGDCATDPDNPAFVLEVNITDLSGSASIIVSDDQGSPNQTATAPGIITMGPYAANTVVTITTIKSDDDTCDQVSSPITFICPPPPNLCSIVYAGEDQEVDCDDTTTDLTAVYHLFGQDSNNYVINGLDSCPLPPAVGGTPTSLDIDDIWSDVLDIGFEFCFFGDVYDQILIGSNGVLSFELENAGNYNGWPFTETLPNNTNGTLAEANIFGVGHDIDPSVCGDINYLVIGSAPYRQFVVNYTSICHFSCNELLSSSQIILYESSNNIDINVFDKPTCPGWNSGNAVIGVQNIAGNVAFVPPGRNTGNWTATDEFYRFAPFDDVPSFVFEWFDGATSLGNTETITVTPTVTTTYTATVIYDLCTGGTATVTDEVTVTVETTGGPEAEFTMTPTCDGGTATIIGDPGGTFGFSPDPGDGAVIDPVTGTVTGGTPGETYDIQYVVGTTGPCPAASIVSLTLLDADDASFTMSPTCDGGTATVTGTPGGTFAFNPVPADGAVIDPDTGTVTGGTAGGSYTIEYTTTGACSSTSTQTLNTLIDGGIFIEDFGTGTVRESIPYTTYTFNEFTQMNDGEYAINNNASDLNTGWHDMEDHTAGDTDGLMFVVNASIASDEFYRRSIAVSENTDYNFSAWITTVYDTDTFICPGTGVPANVTFRIEDVAGTLITEVNTGDIQNEANPNWQEYQLNFNTLTNSEVQIVLFNQGIGGCGNDLAIDDISLIPVAPMLSFTADCDGGTTTVTGSTGGTFVLNPDPGDGAVIDPNTGTITGGTLGATYTIVYSVLGGCSTTSLDVTLLPAEDASFMMTPTCDGGTATITGDTGGAFALNPEPGDGAVIDVTTGTVTGGATSTTYTVEYTSGAPCSARSSQTVTTLSEDDASFTMTATCDGGIATITGETGGTFAFNPVPGDGAVIDATTGTVTGGTAGTTYTVEYTSSVVCTATSTQTVTVLPTDDATFTFTATCDGGTATIVGDAGGSFTFNPIPSDGAMIDSMTGTVTGGTAGTTYTIEYTTSGVCPSSSTVNTTLLTSVFDFNVVGDCNGAIFELTINPIGDSYNPNTATYVLYDDMDSVLVTNPVGDNVFVISESIFTPPMGGSTFNYVVEVTNADGCVETNTVLVDSINCIIPQAISPNDDNFNDNFDLSGYNVSRLEIFNRHGIKVYSKTNYTNEWYGQTDDGKELPVGTYFYVMEYQGNKTRSSWVYINK